MQKPKVPSEEVLDAVARKIALQTLEVVGSKIMGARFGNSHEARAVFIATAVSRIKGPLDKYEEDALAKCREYLLDCMVHAIETIDSTRLRRIADAVDEAKKQAEAGTLGTPANRTMMLAMFYIAEQGRDKKMVTRRGLLDFLAKENVNLSERQASTILSDLGFRDKRGRRKADD